MIDKKWIETNLFTKTNTMNNRISNPNWWIKRNLEKEYEFIINFIPNSGNIFQPIYHIYHGLSREIKKCRCGKNLEFLQFSKGYRKNCSLECSYQNPERNKKISENFPKEKMLKSYQKTIKERYGVDYYFQTKEFQEKASKTKLDRYGDSEFNNIDKMIHTNMKKYGVKYSFQRPDIAQKIKNSIMEKRPERDVLLELNSNQKLSMKEISDKFSVTPKTIISWFRDYNIEPIFWRRFGDFQNTFYEKLIQLFPGEDFIMNDKSQIWPKELDIYSPSKKLAIEVNGCYWHSEDQNRHIDKLEMCRSKDIRLLQFWDHEVIESEEIVIGIIRNCLGLNQKIYARNCKVVNLDSVTYRDFMEKNHIQGPIPSKLKLGLEYEGELVYAIGLSKPRFDRSIEYELIRSCGKIGYNVIGGLSRLLSKVDGNIVSYVDRRLFTGKSLETIGWKYEKTTPPNYFWYKSNSKRLSRYKTQKHKLKDVLGENFDPNLSEHENMNKMGWLKVYDCGNLVYKNCQIHP